MRILSTFLLLSSIPTYAQWTSIVSNQDGTRVYFVTRLRQQGSSQPFYGKVFAVDSSGVHPLLIRNRDVTTFSFPTNAYTTNAYDMVGLDVAADVSRLAVVATGECQITDTLCSNDHAVTTVYDATGVGTDFAGRGRLSPDGRWLSLITISPYFFGLGPTQASVTNLNDNTATAFSFSNSSRDYKSGSVANDGSFAFGAGSNGLSVSRSGSPIVTIAGDAADARLDASGNTVVWTQSMNGHSAIQTANTNAPAARTLLSPDSGAYSPSLSSDGTKVLFLSADSLGIPQAFLTGIDGSGLTQLTRESEGLTEVTLSPDRQTVLAVGGDGSLLRFRDSGRQRDLLIGPTVSLRDVQLVGSPGQVLRLSGTHLDSAHVQIDGSAGPVIASTSTTLDFQVPWETSLSDSHLITVTSVTGSSGWEGGGQSGLSIAASYPKWVVVAHENFAGLVTSSSPARPGEIIHFYASGLGPVLNAPATGQPTPDSPLSPLVTPNVFRLALTEEGTAQYSTPEILFQGLAPRTIGYYQVSIRLPTTLTTGTWSLETQTALGFAPATDIPVNQK